MYESILVPFVAIAIAEFLDKSQISILLLASKTKHHAHLLAGIFLAFLIVDGSAVLFGAWLTSIFPLPVIKLISGTLFLLFGIKALLEKDDGKQKVKKLKNTFLTGFSIIFVSEWGDKTQLASALFATRYNPWAVLLGVLLALMLLSTAAVFLSHVLTSKFERRLITKVAGVIFIILGVSFLFLS